jgi:DNA repair photolyase
VTTPLQTYQEIEAKSLLRESNLVDPWFLGNFGANLYRGCAHDCAYCDGRAERYYVDGDFGRDIVVKRNALVLAEKELARRREPGFLFLGGGVSDCYQPAEADYRLARGLLELAARSGLGVHVLTKSRLVERDFDLLQQIARGERAILSFSIQTLDDDVRAKLEPNASSIAERLRLLHKVRALGVHGGIMAMPILPGISDSKEQIVALAERAADSGAEFVCFGGLTLRPGRQKDTYYSALHQHWPNLVLGYDRAYGRALSSGAPDPRYGDKVNHRFAHALGKVGLPARIPRQIFHGIVPLYTEAGVLLEHLETAARLKGEHRLLAPAGLALAKWAHQRLVTVCRRQGFSYRDVEAEFAYRLADGSLREVAGINHEAMQELLSMGFAAKPAIDDRPNSGQILIG